jgi:hypothetical protein
VVMEVETGVFHSRMHGPSFAAAPAILFLVAVFNQCTHCSVWAFGIGCLDSLSGPCKCRE